MSKLIIDNTAHDDPKFLLARIEVLKENLLNCHNENQMLYGAFAKSRNEVKALKKENNDLKVELSIHGIEFKDQNNEESI